MVLMTMNKKTISWLLVIIWAGVIFTMSSMDGEESCGESRKIANQIVVNTEHMKDEASKNTEKVPVQNSTDGAGRTEKRVIDRAVIEKVNLSVRKFAHMGEFLVFEILLMVALLNSGLSMTRAICISLAICFLYACTDEYHQTFVDGRTGQLEDVMIDGLGGVVGSGLCYMCYSMAHRKKLL